MNGHTTPHVVRTVAELRTALDVDRLSGCTVGFVPTMGFLHRGHQSLIEAAVRHCDRVVVSIFVNPLQFAPEEDFEDYPRDLPADIALCGKTGAHVVFAPSVKDMYPHGAALTEVNVPALAKMLEGRTRPMHFTGVATVVAKLFCIVGSCRAFFGEKDYQQLALVRRMSADLNMPVDVVGCPTVRESDGLAMSSRNSYLSAEERAAAPVLHRALRIGVAAIRDGVHDPVTIVEKMQMEVQREPLAALDYAAVVDAENLDVPIVIDDRVRLLIAARIGQTRLIDNTGVVPSQPPSQ